MDASVELLSTEMTGAFDQLTGRLDGLADEEFFWEPVPDPWTLRWKANGTWGYDYAFPDPDPSPFTTIAWRISHVATCKIMYHEYGFGPRKLTWAELRIPRSVPESVAMLHEGQALLVADVDGLEDADLQAPRSTNWGETWPAWRIFWTMINHDLWHGGEIGVLRDLYRLSLPTDGGRGSAGEVEHEMVEPGVAGDLGMEGRGQ
jgi:hypothetical protein